MRFSASRRLNLFEGLKDGVFDYFYNLVAFLSFETYNFAEKLQEIYGIKPGLYMGNSFI